MGVASRETGDNTVRRAEVENALRQEDRLRVNTPNGPGWVHGPLDDSGSVRVGFDDGTSGKVQIDDLERPRQPRPAAPDRGPWRCRYRTSGTAPSESEKRGSEKVRVEERQQYGAWFYAVLVDDFSDRRTHSAVTHSGDEVWVIVRCDLEIVHRRIEPVRRLDIYTNDDGMFHNGEIDLRWMGGAKDGEIESYMFIHDENKLAAPLLEVDSIISSLKSHSELRLRFRRQRDPVFTTDRVSLNGAARAIDSLPCMNP